MFEWPRPNLLPLADGRTLDYATVGDGGGGTLVFHHGKPMAGDPPNALIEACIGVGMRVVAYDRPGYAASSTAYGRDVASAASDTAALLDHLGVADCVVLGWSAGGPHALACVAGLGRRVTGVATVAGVAPKHPEGLDWTAGMMIASNIAEFNLGAGMK